MSMTKAQPSVLVFIIEFRINLKLTLVSNFIAFSEIAKRPTFAMVLFWNKAKKLLERNN